MTKLISGRVKKIPSANVSASRYDFIKLSETEPDLGLPAANGYVLSGNVDGTRRWVLPAAVATAAENANVANTVLSISNFTTANLAEGVNLYYTNARVYANVIGLLNVKANVGDLTTANVVELTNLYYTNARVYSNVIGLLNAKANVSDLTTANVVESTNSLYYTNARVDSYVTPKLTTANVVESAGNLYYTNARVQNYLEHVDGNILPISSGPYDIGSETHAWRDLWLQGTSVKFVNSGAISAQANTFTITDAGGNVVFTANATNIPITSPDGKLSASLLSGVVNYSTSNVAEGSNLYYTNARVDSYVTPKLTTANVIESAGNLYYTEARANLAINNRVTKTFVENLGISVNTATFAQTANVANTVLSLNNFTTANLAEGTNLYYTNARVYSNVIGLINVKANISDLTTANVTELTNLYYTEARANIAIDARVNKSFVENLGITVSNANVAQTANVANTVLSLSNFTTANLAEGTNLYYTNARVYSNVIPLLSVKANVSDLTTANVAELTNLYYTNARVYSNVVGLIGNKANVSDLTTANVTELNNLYYTNARVYSNVIGLLNAKANVSDLTTANVTEVGNNIFYTNARVYANVSAMLPYYTGNLSAGNVLANTIVSTGGSSGTISATTDFSISAGSNINLVAPNTFANNLTVNRITSNIWTGLYAANIVGLTTANVTELNNLYYTNARVYSNISPLLFNYQTLANAALKANVSDLTTANVAELTNLYYTNARVYSNVIGLLNVKANVSDLTTANVTELNNLYYTNARVYSNVIGLLNAKANVTDLNTSNIIEGNNLYFTNARVLAGLVTSNLVVNDATVLGNLYVEGDVVTLNTATLSIEDKNIVLANGAINSTAADGAGFNIAGAQANLKYRNTGDKFEFNKSLDVLGTITANAWGGLYAANIIGLTTANVAELTNLYYTNARVYSNVVEILPTYTGNVGAGNVTIGSGTGGSLIGANLISATYISATNWIGIYTANVVESSGNLYYTNARAYANLTSASINALADVDTVTSPPTLGQALLWNGTAWIANNITISAVELANVANSVVQIASAALVANTAIFAQNANIANIVLSISNFTTSNLAEGTNLYYTNARVYSNVIGLINVKANVSDLTTANVVELNNLYYTNARVYSNVIGLLDAKANVSDLTTANVIESAGNLYYTITRANIAIDARVNKAFVESLGITTNTSVFAETSNVANIVLSINNFTTSNLAEGTNLYYSNTRVYSNVIGLINVKANVSDLTTANVIESAGNLYYTETRANTAIDARVNKAFVDALGISTNTSIFAQTANIANTVLSISNFTTANLVEGTNLYYTNARVYSNVIGLISVKANVGDLTTANVTELNNLYYTNARVYSNVITLLPTYTGNVNAGNIIANTIIGTGSGGSISGANLISTNVISATTWIGLYAANVIGLTTANVSELNNLYYTNARVYSNVIGLLNAKANVSDLTTSNVVEGNNLYYTNARARTAISAGDTSIIYDPVAGTIKANATITAAIEYQVNNLSTSTVTEGTNLYYTNARVYSNVIALLPTLAGTGIAIEANGQIRSTTSAASITGLNTANVAELTNLYYTNARVYSNVIGLLNDKANVSDLTTANIIESASNLYFSNARVLAGLVGQNVDINDLLVRGDLIVQGNTVTLNTATVIVEDKNLVLANGAVNSGAADGAGFNIDGAQANLMYRSTGDKFEFNKSLDVLGTLTAATVSANVWNNLYTSNVAEGNNLYYTNARVYSNVIGLLNNLATAANLNLKANVVDLTTANVIELTNLYYTNARVYSNISPLLFNYQTLSNAALKANVVDLTTANVTELTNLYYTNARVYANVSAMLPTYTGNVNAGNIIANTIIGTGGGGSITGANLISTNVISATTWIGLYAANIIGLNTANVAELTNLYYTNARVYSNVIGLLNNLATAANLNLKANVSDLTTANVAELTNLYYTNARVYSNVIGLLNAKANVSDLTTANVAEVGNNIFYTNTRVFSNIVALLPVYTGNINAGNIIANTFIGGGGGGFITGANLISTNIISATTWVGLYASNIIGLTTANVTELTNLYYTNARVYSNVIGLLNNLATAANLNLKANVADLTTANVAELTNLYYTNARVYSNVIALLPTYTGNVNAGNIIANTIIGSGGGGGFITGANLISTNVISATTWVGLYASNIIGLTTANVTELTNLYYTNARVYTNVIALLQTLAGNNIIIAANGQISANLLSAGGGAASSVLANGVIGLNTANVNEFGSNLYYTNARVYSNVVNILSTYTGNVNAGNIIANTLIGDGGGGFITGANLISTNIIVASTWTGLYAANIIGLTTANVAELTNLYYTNARVYSNVIGLLNNLASAANLNLKANVSDLTTANVTESPSNLYYTNARVIAGLVGQDVTVNNVTIRGDLIVEGNTVTLNTATVIVEDKNIMLANGAINAAAADGAGFNIDGAQANLKYRNTGDKFEFNKSLDVFGTFTANAWGNLYAANVIGLTTANVSELTNLYYTNTRVYSNVVAMLTTYTGNISAGNIIANTIVGSGDGGGFITGANLISTNIISATNWLGLYAANVVGLTTANVAEVGNNIFYTNARVYSNVLALLPTLAGAGISIAANGQISSTSSAQSIAGLNTANVAESASNLYYTNARVYSNVVAMLPNVGVRIASSFQQFVANGAATVFTLSTSVTDESSIFVIIDGLTQIPTLDYTAANTTLTLLTTPVNQSNVVVRYFSAVLVP